MKNYFYSISKAHLVLKIFEFLPLRFWSCRKRLDKEANVNFKIFDIMNRRQLITIHILPNILGNKGNQAMTFCQLK